jgi:hypothetical protein
MLLLGSTSLPEGDDWQYELFLRVSLKMARVNAALAGFFVASPHRDTQERAASPKNWPVHGGETKRCCRARWFSRSGS